MLLTFDNLLLSNVLCVTVISLHVGIWLIQLHAAKLQEIQGLMWTHAVWQFVYRTVMKELWGFWQRVLQMSGRTSKRDQNKNFSQFLSLYRHELCRSVKGLVTLQPFNLAFGERRCSFQTKHAVAVILFSGIWCYLSSDKQLQSEFGHIIQKHCAVLFSQTYITMSVANFDVSELEVTELLLLLSHYKVNLQIQYAVLPGNPPSNS